MWLPYFVVPNKNSILKLYKLLTPLRMTGSMLCAILDSMLSYSQRMTDINKQRGIAAEGDIELPLLIKATHLSHPTRINRY